MKALEFSKLIQKEMLEKVPEIVKKHKKLYLTLDEESSFTISKKGERTSTVITNTDIEYYDNGLVWGLVIGVPDDEYHNWFPYETEYMFSTQGVTFYLNMDEFFMAEYKFHENKFVMDINDDGDDDFEYEVKNIDDLREMLFTLSLDHANIISTEELWEMLEPMIALYKKIPKGTDVSVIYYNNRTCGVIPLNAEIPKL